ncbi:MAG: hypothetical protein IKP20_03775 [Candidatus Methanomethylophilaceae archaeon]|nr:hypothetical protein [Candidatus Methanomethylophilaceae archaeon]
MIRHVFITVNRVVLGADKDVMSRLVGHADDNIDAAYMDSVLSVKNEIQTRYEEYLELPSHFLKTGSGDTNRIEASFDIFHDSEHLQTSTREKLEKNSLDVSCITERIQLV